MDLIDAIAACVGPFWMCFGGVTCVYGTPVIAAFVVIAAKDAIVRRWKR